MATSVRDVEKVEWDSFVHRYGSIFNLTSWCDLFDKPYRIHGCYKGNELVGGVIQDGFPITPYQGVILKEQKYSITETLIKELPKGTITNHYNFLDIRPFIWSGYKTFVKYTSVLDITDLDRVLRGMDKDTRYMARKPIEATRHGRPDNFWGLYVNMFKRKGLELPISEHIFYKLWTSIPCDIYWSKHSGAVMMYEGDTAYYILGASDENESTALMWYAIQDLHKRFKKLDFVGINLREIGMFKLGFGGAVKTLLGVSNV